MTTFDHHTAGGQTIVDRILKAEALETLLQAI